jgi:hypothetical protein
LICCRFDAKTKFELAIEFKVVDNLNNLETNSKNKSFYLPVDTLDNPDIDLIPIELNSNKNLNVNSLQLIRNFSKLNLNENLINLKVFNSRVNDNNELTKSIFELNDFNQNYDLILGYNLTKKELFLTPVKLNSKTLKTNLLEQQSDIVREFKLKKQNEFKMESEKYLANFNQQMHKLELFEFNLDLKKLFTLKKKKKKIIHFSDLASLGKSFSSDTLMDTVVTSHQRSVTSSKNQFKPHKYYSFKIRNNRKLSTHKSSSSSKIMKRSNSV